MDLVSLLSVLVNASLNPFILITGLMLTGAVLLAMGHRRAGQGLVYAASIYFATLLLLPLDLWLARPLENRFARAALPEQIDGILVLDGGVDGAIMATRGAFASEPAPLRLIAGATLLRRFPAARLVYTGSILDRPEYTDEAARIIFGDLGIDPARVTVENRARNTWGNIAFSKERVQPKAGETWVLVTSAIHMPRAVGVARQLGWPVIAWPSDYLMRGEYNFFDWGRPPEDRLRAYTAALHEWVGLLAYRLQGRAGTLFPGPEA